MAVNPLDQITKLAELHDQGILTREEFETKKRDLLSRVTLPDMTYSADPGPDPGLPLGFDLAPSQGLEAKPAAPKGPPPLPVRRGATIPNVETTPEVVVPPPPNQPLAELLRELQHSLKQFRKTAKRVNRETIYWHFLTIVRGPMVSALSVPGAIAVWVVGVCALCILACAAFLPVSVGPLIYGTLAGLILGSASAVHVFYRPSKVWVQYRLDDLAEHARVLKNRIAQVESRIAPTKVALAQANERAREAERAAEDRKQRLLTAKWRGMGNLDFERFLTELFRELGYEVALTKTTGDHGADMILTRDGERIAVQANASGQRVDKNSVQEILDGMATCGCQRCAIITNRQFTGTAEKLAATGGCRLIGEDSIVGLINGTITL